MEKAAPRGAKGKKKVKKRKTEGKIVGTVAKRRNRMG